MRMERIGSDMLWSDFLVVRMLRRWAAVRSLGEKALPNLVRLAGELGEQPQVAISLHSLFQLTESCLRRPLEPECCCTKRVSRDEEALLVLIGCVPERIPHGLPGVLAWAAVTVRLMLGRTAGAPQAAPPTCPFDRAG